MLYSERDLSALYEAAKNIPSGIRLLFTNPHLTPDNLDFLDHLDRHDLDLTRRLRALDRQVEASGGWEVARLETDEEKMALIVDKITMIEQDFELMKRMDRPAIERQLMAIVRGYDRWKKLRDKIRSRMLYAAFPQSDRVTDSDIEAARHVPLEDLVEPNKQQKILCPFHADRNPSMYVANGFGHCFSCGAWTDAIKYLMTTQNINFVDAVKALRNY